MTTQDIIDIRLNLSETGFTREDIEIMARLHRISLNEFVLRALALHMADCQSRLADPSFTTWQAANIGLPPKRID